LVRVLERGIFLTPPEPQQQSQQASQGIVARPQQVKHGAFKMVKIGLNKEDLEKLEALAAQYGLEVPEELKKIYTVRPEAAEKIRQSLREKLDKFLKQLEKKHKEKQQAQQPQQVVTDYEVFLKPEILQQLEVLAAQYGLEVPEELKKKYTVKSEQEKQQVEQTLSDLLREFVETLEERQDVTYKMELQAIAEKTHLPVSDTGIYVMPKVITRTIKKEQQGPGDDINVDQLLKEIRGQKLLEYQEELKAAQQEVNPYEGYELYYEGLRALREDLGLFSEETKKITVDVDPSQFSHPRARARGLSTDVEIDLGKEESQPEQIPLYFDQTKTWEDIQKEQKAWREVETASNIVARTIGIDYDQEDSKAERFLKGLGIGAITFFTWPVDIAMTAAQWDEIQRAAAEEGKSVREFMIENIKESFKDPGTWGEITGSLLTSYGVTKLVRFTTPKVYEQKGGLSGYRQMMWEIKVDEDDLARAIRTEAFDYDEVTRITIQNKLFGPKEIKVETIPQKFTTRAYESITAGDNIATTMRIMDVPLGPGDVHVGTVRISRMGSLGDDFGRFVEESGRVLVNTEDIMNFLKEAQKGGKAPNELIKIIQYETDDATRMIIKKGIYDDIVKTSVEIKNFQDDLLKNLGGKGKSGAGGSLDNIIKTSADDVIKPPSAPGGGTGGQVLQLDDALKQLDDTTFKVTEKTGERVLVSSGDNIVVPPGWTADISNEMRSINNEISNVFIDTGIDSGTKKGERQDTRVIESTGTDEALKTIIELEHDIRQAYDQETSLDIKPEFETRTKTKTIQEMRTEEPFDFSVRDFYDEIVKISQEQRQLYATLTAELEIPKPKPKKTKIKEKPKKRINVKVKKKKPRTRKKRRREGGFDWEEWIGYEDLFEI